VIRKLPAQPSVADATQQSLELSNDDRIAIYYAPFDFINQNARSCDRGLDAWPDADHRGARSRT
jgi:hypothetical protein